MLQYFDMKMVLIDYHIHVTWYLCGTSVYFTVCTPILILQYYYSIIYTYIYIYIFFFLNLPFVKIMKLDYIFFINYELGAWGPYIIFHIISSASLSSLSLSLSLTLGPNYELACNKYIYFTKQPCRVLFLVQWGTALVSSALRPGWGGVLWDWLARDLLGAVIASH